MSRSFPFFPLSFSNYIDSLHILFVSQVSEFNHEFKKDTFDFMPQAKGRILMEMCCTCVTPFFFF